jgi:hypothetical protein
MTTEMLGLDVAMPVLDIEMLGLDVMEPPPTQQS